MQEAFHNYGPRFQTTAAVKSLQSCPTLCDRTDSSPPGSPIPGILWARILEWVVTSLFNACMYAKSHLSCLTLGEPMESSPPSSSVHGLLQARILVWVAISFSDFKPHMLQTPNLHSGIRACQYRDWHLEDKCWNFLVFNLDHPFCHYWAY